MTFHRLVSSVSGSAGSALLHQFLVELDHGLLPVGTRFGRQSFSENRDFFSSRFITLPSGEKKPFGASALFLSGGDFHHSIATFRAAMSLRWLASVAL